jgi:hypothetical protein
MDQELGKRLITEAFFFENADFFHCCRLFYAV